MSGNWLGDFHAVTFTVPCEDGQIRSFLVLTDGERGTDGVLSCTVDNDQGISESVLAGMLEQAAALLRMPE